MRREQLLEEPQNEPLQAAARRVGAVNAVDALRAHDHELDGHRRPQRPRRLAHPPHGVDAQRVFRLAPDAGARQRVADARDDRGAAAQVLRVNVRSGEPKTGK